MVTKKTKAVKVKAKRFKILHAYEQYCIAHTDIAECTIVYLYATTLKKLSEHMLPEVLDFENKPAQFKKHPREEVLLIDVGDCDYRKVLHVEDFPKTNIANTNLSFLKDKYNSGAFEITITLQGRKLYFLGPKIDIKNIKTSWF